jgi:hypothetical protein
MLRLSPSKKTITRRVAHPSNLGCPVPCVLCKGRALASTTPGGWPNFRDLRNVGQESYQGPASAGPTKCPPGCNEAMSQPWETWGQTERFRWLSPMGPVKTFSLSIAGNSETRMAGGPSFQLGVPRSLRSLQGAGACIDYAGRMAQLPRSSKRGTRIVSRHGFSRADQVSPWMQRGNVPALGNLGTDGKFPIVVAKGAGQHLSS